MTVICITTQIYHSVSAAAKKVLQQALEENPFVPAYLLGQKRVPNRRLDYYGWGDESDAVYYAGEHLNSWRRIMGQLNSCARKW